jgi:hypothetical protein
MKTYSQGQQIPNAPNGGLSQEGFPLVYDSNSGQWINPQYANPADVLEQMPGMFNEVYGLGPPNVPASQWGQQQAQNPTIQPYSDPSQAVSGNPFNVDPYNTLNQAGSGGYIPYTANSGGNWTAPSGSGSWSGPTSGTDYSNLQSPYSATSYYPGNVPSWPTIDTSQFPSYLQNMLSYLNQNGVNVYGPLTYNPLSTDTSIGYPQGVNPTTGSYPAGGIPGASMGGVPISYAPSTMGGSNDLSYAGGGALWGTSGGWGNDPSGGWGNSGGAWTGETS